MGNSLTSCCNSICWLLVLINIAWPIALLLSTIWVFLQVRLIVISSQFSQQKSHRSHLIRFSAALRTLPPLCQEHFQYPGAIRHLATRVRSCNNEWHPFLSYALSEQSQFNSELVKLDVTDMLRCRIFTKLGGTTDR